MNLFGAWAAIGAMPARVGLLLLLLTGSGCSTINTLTSAEEHPRIYSGTRWNIGTFDPEPTPYGGLRRTFAIVDFPWSLALDTLVLPFTAAAELIAD